MLAALVALGAEQTAELLRRASAAFPGGMPPADLLARRALHGRLSDVVRDGWDALDAEFWTYPDDLGALPSAPT